MDMDLRRRMERFNRIPGKLLTFDLTNSCNLTCFYCTWFQDPKHTSQPRKSISLVDLKKVCEEFLTAGTSFETIALSVSGEPIMNPEFDAIIAFLFETNGKEKRLFRYLSINSNGTVLTKRKVDLIHRYLSLGYGELQLTISLNAASRESFLKSKHVDLYDRTVENVRYLLAEKARLGLNFEENIYLQFLVNEMIEDEAEAFLEFWSAELKKIGLPFKADYALPVDGAHVILIFKRIYADSNIFTLSQEQYDEMHRKVSARLKLKPECEESDLNKNVPVFYGKSRKVCGSPWLSPIIRRDGTLNFCLTDVDNAMPIGNVFEKTFFELWLSPKAEVFRQKMIREEYGALCKDCNYFDGISIPQEVQESYLNDL